MRRIVLGGLLGAIALPALVFAGYAVRHYVRFGNWTEFWGLVLAIRAIPYGFVLGAILAFVIRRRRMR